RRVMLWKAFTFTSRMPFVVRALARFPDRFAVVRTAKAHTTNSMIEPKLGTVEQDPKDIGEPSRLVFGRRVAEVQRPSLAFVDVRRPAQGRQIQDLDSLVATQSRRLTRCAERRIAGRVGRTRHERAVAE